MAIRKVVVLEFDDSEEVVDSAGEKVPVADWEKVLTNATPKAPEKPAEPTESQMRARHRDAVSRTVAAVDKLLTTLPDNVHGIRAELVGLVGRAESPASALSAYIRALLTYTVPEPLPQPTVIPNFMHQVRITSGGFRGYVPYPEKVTRFLDYFQDNQGLW